MIHVAYRISLEELDLVRRVREAETHRLVAGDPALDFANTLNGHTHAAGHEYLHDFRDLALWCRHAGILTAGEARQMLRNATTHPAEARELYQRTLGLREAIFRVFHAIAIGRKPPLQDLEQLNAAWRAGQRHAEVRRAPAGFLVGWDDGPLLDRIPRVISSAAVQTLISGRASRVKACAGAGCDWLFVDDSRNHLRRWCSMDECGNRAKMRRRQQRKQLAMAGRNPGSSRRRKRAVR